MGNTLKKNYLLLSEKRWHDALFHNISRSISGNWYRINAKDDFTVEKINSVKPDKIFIPHWSYIIPSGIYENFDCIVFHMTDLPFGRGGSPLQNLIVRGFEETRITAFKVQKGIDTGDIYLKQKLSLNGTAEEIFIRASEIIGKMIVEIIANNIKPVPQQGEITVFQRRKPEASNIAEITDVQKIVDHIRMLDAEGYPHAYVETDFFRLEFTKAILNNDNTITANVRIIKK